MNDETARITQIRMETEIDSDADGVWAALTDNIGEWWPAEFYAGGEAGARSFSLEAWPGGRMLETWAAGGGVLWGTVVGIELGVRLQVLGDVFPNWGGPSSWYGTWEVTAKDGRTCLTFTESVIGRISDDGVAEKDKGWRFLWATMKAHLEGTSAPQWSD